MCVRVLHFMCNTQEHTHFLAHKVHFMCKKVSVFLHFMCVKGGNFVCCDAVLCRRMIKQQSQINKERQINKETESHLNGYCQR